MSVFLSDYKLAMFDLDGTLVDSALDIHAALNASLTKCGYPEVAEGDTRMWVGNGAQALVNRALFKRLHVNEEHSDLTRVLGVFYDVYREENGRRSQCYDGALALFEKLELAGVQVAIVTNKPYEPAKALISQVGLRCALLLGGDSLDKKKPAPEPLLHCLEHFAVAKNEAVMIGDSVNDFEAAHAAGVDVVGVSYGYNHGLPIDPRNLTGFVDSLTELG